MDSRQLQLVLKLQDQASAELRKVSGELGNVGKAATQTSSGFMGMAKSIAGVAAAYVSFQSVYSAFSMGVTMAADMETAQVGLTTLLGSAEKAADTVARLKVESARTPFELPGLTQATQLLTSVTKDGNKSIDIILDIGEGLAAMGKGQSELDRIIVNLQQIAATGKAATIDIKQFAFAGIPIYEMLAETTGKNGEELSKLIEDGGITFDVLTKMFDEANDAGGRFHNAFVNQAGTFNQAASNMKDSFGIMMSDIVTSSGIFDGLTESMIAAAGAMGNWRGVLEGARSNLVMLIETINEHTGLITHMKIAWQTIAELFATTLQPALAELWLALQPLLPYLKELGEELGTVLIVVLHLVIGAFTILATGITAVLTGLVSLVTFIVNTATLAFRTLQNYVEGVAAVFVGDWGGAIESVKNQIADLIDWVSSLIDMFERAIDLAKDIGGGAIDFISKVLPGRASGGPVVGGMPHMVGEMGPEVFVPSTSGRIVSNGKLGGLGGSSLSINIYGDVTGEEIVHKVGKVLMQELNQRIRTA